MDAEQQELPLPEVTFEYLTDSQLSESHPQIKFFVLSESSDDSEL